MRFNNFTLLLLTVLLVGCGVAPVIPTPTPVPSPTPVVAGMQVEITGEIFQCVADQPDVQWDGDASYVAGTTSSSSFLFDAEQQKVVLAEIEIGADNSEAKRGIMRTKEICDTAAAAESKLKNCLRSWDPYDMCLSTEELAAQIDAFAFSYLTVEEQRLFLEPDMPSLHIERGDTVLTCERAKVFEVWSERQLIRSQDWTSLIASVCNP